MPATITGLVHCCRAPACVRVRAFPHCPLCLYLVLILQAALYDIFLRELEPQVGVDIIAAEAEVSHGRHRHISVATATAANTKATLLEHALTLKRRPEHPLHCRRTGRRRGCSDSGKADGLE